MRTFVAVIIGELIFALSDALFFQLTGHKLHQDVSTLFMIAAAAYGIGFAIAAGYIAMWLSRRRDLAAPFALAVLIALIAFMTLMARNPGTSRWSMFATIVLMAPAAVLGGVLRERFPRRG